MAGEIQLNSTTMATESSGTITLSNVNSATNRTNLGLGSMATQNANAVALTGGSITGTTIVPTTPFSFRNRIINGNLSNPINQRGAGSIAASTGYNYDRWYYDGSTYLYQGIEDKNVNNGTYVISWEGAGINAAWKVSTDTTAGNGPDATTGFTSVSNGGTFTVNEGTEYSKHLWIRFDGTLANLDKVMVEEGTVATPFEHRPIELALCQRYFQIFKGSATFISRISAGQAYTTTNTANHNVSFVVSMRCAPTLSQSGLRLWSPNVGVRDATILLSTNTNENGANILSDSSSGLVAGDMWYIAGSDTSSYAAFSSEL